MPTVSGDQNSLAVGNPPATVELETEGDTAAAPSNAVLTNAAQITTLSEISIDSDSMDSGSVNEIEDL